LNSSTTWGGIRAGPSTWHRRAGIEKASAPTKQAVACRRTEIRKTDPSWLERFPGSPPDRARRRACVDERHENARKIAHRFWRLLLAPPWILPSGIRERPSADSSDGVKFPRRTLLFSTLRPACLPSMPRRPPIAYLARIDGSRGAQGGPFVKWAGGKTSLLPELHSTDSAACAATRAVRRWRRALFSLRPRRAFLPIQTRPDPRLPHLQSGRVWPRSSTALSLRLRARATLGAVRALDPLRLPARKRAARFIITRPLKRPRGVNRAGRLQRSLGRYRPPPSSISGRAHPGSQACRSADSSTPLLRAFPREGARRRLRLPRSAYDPFPPPRASPPTRATPFGWADQEAPRGGCAALNRRGVRFLLSPTPPPSGSRRLYRGFRAAQSCTPRPATVELQADGRGRVDELLVFNG